MSARIIPAIRLTLTCIACFRRFLSQFSTDFHEIVYGLFATRRKKQTFHIPFTQPPELYSNVGRKLFFYMNTMIPLI